MRMPVVSQLLLTQRLRLILPPATWRLLLCLLVVPVGAFGQPERLRFEHLTVENGLSLNGISCMMQDSKGYLWIGTPSEGLNKYDGYRFIAYKFDPYDATSLSKNTVWKLWEDRAGNIWVGTTETTCRFDPRTEKFTRFERDSLHPYAVKGAQAMNEDKAGNLWIGGAYEGELRQFDQQKGTFSAENFSPLLGAPANNARQHISVLFRDRSGTLWIGGRTGLQRMNVPAKSDAKPTRPGFTTFAHDPQNPNSLSSNTITSLYEDRAGMLWVGTPDAGLNRFDPRTGQVTRFGHDPNNPNSLSGNNVNRQSIVEDADGYLWVGTTNGLNKIDPDRSRITRYFHDPGDPTGLTSNLISCLLIDKAGTLWVGTNEGINRLDPIQKPFILYRHNPLDPNSITDNKVIAVHETKDGTVWAGTRHGLNVLDRTTGQMTHFRYDAKHPEGLQTDTVSAIHEDRQGNLWIANGRALSVLNRQTRTFTHHPLDHPFQSHPTAPPIFTLYEDKAGIFWLGTTNGLLRFDPRTDRTVSYTYKPDDPTGISDFWALTIAEDAQGYLWIGTGSKALNRFDPRTGRFTHYRYDSQRPGSISSNTVHAIVKDRQGTMWFGTIGGGLCQFDYKTGRFMAYTERHGLAGNSIYSMLEDNDGDLWLGTSGGLSRFSVGKKTFKNYTTHDKLKNNQFIVGAQGPTYKGQDGTLYFGGSSGLILFNPAAIRSNPYQPPVVITHFKLFDKLVPGIQESGEIKLRYNQNFFSFEFAALNYTSSYKNQYAYQLEGIDKDWVFSGTRRLASYTDVSPGEYTFRVKGSNNDGVWNNQGMAIRIVITPPWWRTGWFMTLSVLALAGLVYLGFRLRVGQIRKEEAQKTAMNKKISEMEMQALRAQMNPHFIFNCLNSINRFILKNQSEAASDYLSKFSKLIRLILQNSNTPTVTLENELEALRLYMEMEALRFEGKFTFQIYCDPEIEADYIEIPTLIIQPYVENAIWHGLMHKEGMGHISIEIQQENGILVCEIEDDGIGRKRAAELKSKSATKNKSMGMQITSHRLELIHVLYGKQATVEVQDLVDPAGEACGTRVLLRIPV